MHPAPELAGRETLPELMAFLEEADLTLSGLDSPGTRVWITRDEFGQITGSTGFELSDDNLHCLIRSVAVLESTRHQGTGSALAQFALERGAEAGAERAWLFSRRSGPFWQKLGFEPADREALAMVLAETAQVALFRSTGQLGREIAWSRAL